MKLMLCAMIIVHIQWTCFIALSNAFERFRTLSNEMVKGDPLRNRLNLNRVSTKGVKIENWVADDEV